MSDDDGCDQPFRRKRCGRSVFALGVCTYHYAQMKVCAHCGRRARPEDFTMDRHIRAIDRHPDKPQCGCLHGPTKEKE